MKEKRKKEKKHGKKNKQKEDDRKLRKRQSSSSSSSGSDEWVEKSSKSTKAPDREDWMSMTGMLKTYTKDDIKPKREEKNKNHIDSYNPATSSRELNPYWKDGGTGIPQTAESLRKSRQFIKPSDDDDDYYTKPSRSYDGLKSSNTSSRRDYMKPTDDDDYYTKPTRNYDSTKSSNTSSRRDYTKPTDDDYTKPTRNYDSPKSLNTSSRRAYMKPTDDDDDDYYTKPTRNYDSPKTSNSSSRHDNKSDRTDSDQRSYNWKKQGRSETKSNEHSNDHVNINDSQINKESSVSLVPANTTVENKQKSLYMSDEKLNKLAAKVVKAEIMGDTNLVAELKSKLEAAREYRKQNPHDKGEAEDEGIMLISTSSSGNSRPLTNTVKGDAKSKGGKRKAETHASGERTKYFANDDRYNLAEMFQQEKYGNNYDDEAELAKIAGKHKNPNDDLEDIFMDNISKNRNEAQDRDAEKQRAINQHKKIERSLEGCEHCLDSKNMLKHLIVSCGNKVYVAMPSKQSLVPGQCIITTIQHATCVTALDEDVWEEIMTYRKALTRFYNSQDKDVVFFEMATKLHRFPHLVINCVPLPRDVGDTASIYFKKALLECEMEWSMNKKVVDLKGKNIRKGVPKGLPYFWVDFGMDPGFAHVIEDQQLFPKTFGEEIIGGILDLDHHLWMNPRKEYGDIQRKKVLDFLKDWKQFDPVSSS